MIELRQVSKTFQVRGQPVHALLPTDLSVPEGKVVGLLGASVGAFGTIRALPHVSFIFSNLGSIVLPVVAVPAADKLFNADGSIANERQAKGLEDLGARVAKFATATR